MACSGGAMSFRTVGTLADSEGRQPARGWLAHRQGDGFAGFLCPHRAAMRCHPESESMHANLRLCAVACSQYGRLRAQQAGHSTVSTSCNLAAGSVRIPAVPLFGIAFCVVLRVGVPGSY